VLLTRAGRIVLAVAADATSVVGTEAVDPLVAAALGPAAASGLFGLVTVPAAPDGIVRHVPTTLLDARGQPRPTFAGRVAMLADGRVRATADAGVLIDYAVDGARFARMGWRAFDAALDAGTRFDDRVLLVGGEFTGSGDRHRIPGPRRLVADVSGLTLQAVIVDGLLQQRWLEAPPAWSIWLVVGAAVSASVLAALWVRRAAAVLATVTALILAATAASVLLLRVGVVVPLAAPAALLGVALGAALVLRGRMTKCPE
jgi:CHASE2 domain-containing sensor protein